MLFRSVFDKVHEELNELHAARADKDIDAIREEYGDLLFAMVSLARHLGIDSEQALRLATEKFESRLGEVARLAGAQGIDLTIATNNEKNGLWDQAKTVLSKH